MVESADNLCLYVDQTRLRMVEYGNIRVKGSVYWNFVPAEIRTIEKYKNYKTRLKDDEVFKHDEAGLWN